MLSNLLYKVWTRRKFLNFVRDVCCTTQNYYAYQIQMLTSERLCQVRNVGFTFCVTRNCFSHPYKKLIYERNGSLLLSSLSHRILPEINYLSDDVTSSVCYSTKSSRFSLKNESFRKYLDALEAELAEIVMVQGTGGSVGSRANERKMFLVRVVEVYRLLKESYQELEELKTMQADKEMAALAKEDVDICLQDIEEQESHLVHILAPEDHIDECDIHLEVESGAGGQEAMLFADEMFRMYQRYSEHNGWRFDVVHLDRADNGIRSASATICGQDVYRNMKYEGGVHRVQRVPKTEKSGRMHTSTVSVAVLPQPTEIDIVINPKDLRIDYFRSSGPGGQHVNKTESAVRVTHLPTGVVAECQQSRSQIQNKATALKVLRARLYEAQLKEQMSQYDAQRKMQAGSKNRSDKVRTYNFPQDRVTDHRLAYNYNNIASFMLGGSSLEKMGQELLAEAKRENLELLLDSFEREQLKSARKGTK